MANKQHLFELYHVGRLARIRRSDIDAFVESLGREQATNDADIPSSAVEKK